MMAARAPLMSTPTLRGGNPDGGKLPWMLSPRKVGGATRKRGHRAATEDATMEGGALAGHEVGRAGGKDGEIVEARRRRVARPAAVLRSVRRAVEEAAGKAG